MEEGRGEAGQTEPKRLSTPPLKFSLVLPFLSTLILGFFGSLPSLYGCFLSIGRMSLLKSILENLEEEEGRTASIGKALRRLVVSSSRRLVVSSSRRLVVSLSSRRLAFVSSPCFRFAGKGALVLSGPIFCLFFCGGLFMPPSLRHRHF